MSFNATGKYFSFQTNDITLNETVVHVFLQGSFGGKVATIDFHVILLYLCYVSSLTPIDFYSSPINYRIGQGHFTISFQEFIDYEDCVYPISYSYKHLAYLAGVVDPTNVPST